MIHGSGLIEKYVRQQFFFEKFQAPRQDKITEFDSFQVLIQTYQKTNGQPIFMSKRQRCVHFTAICYKMF
jgi:hypothetical protein